MVGVVDIEWREDDLYLARIELSPELQNLGLGAAIIEGLIDLGARRERALTLDVFDVNQLGVCMSALVFNRSVSADRRSTCGGLRAE